MFINTIHIIQLYIHTHTNINTHTCSCAQYILYSYIYIHTLSHRCMQSTLHVHPDTHPSYRHTCFSIDPSSKVCGTGREYCIHTLLFAPVITVACERSLPFCQKCSGWQVTAIHMCTLPTLHIYTFAHCPCYHSSMWKIPAILPKVQWVAGYSYTHVHPTYTAYIHICSLPLLPQ